MATSRGSTRSSVRRRPIAVTVVAGLVMVCCLAGCQEDGSAPGGPTVICGSTLNQGAEMPLLYPLTRTGTAAITEGDGNGHVYLRLTRDCARGADLTITPAGSYRVIKTARARDGKPVAVELARLTSARATVTATRSGTVLGHRVVQISPGRCGETLVPDARIAADVHLRLRVKDPTPTATSLDVTTVYTAVTAPVMIQAYFPITDVMVYNAHGLVVARISPNEVVAPAATLFHLRPGRPVTSANHPVHGLLTCAGKSLRHLPPGKYTLIGGDVVQLVSYNGKRLNAFPNRMLVSAPAGFTIRR